MIRDSRFALRQYYYAMNRGIVEYLSTHKRTMWNTQTAYIIYTIFMEIFSLLILLPRPIPLFILGKLWGKKAHVEHQRLLKTQQHYDNDARTKLTITFCNASLCMLCTHLFKLTVSANVNWELWMRMVTFTNSIKCVKHKNLFGYIFFHFPYITAFIVIYSMHV